jgi:hypothetical protein
VLKHDPEKVQRFSEKIMLKQEAGGVRCASSPDLQTSSRLRLPIAAHIDYNPFQPSIC